MGIIPLLYLEYLADRSFQTTHKIRFSYVEVAMARGIATSELVVAFAKTAMIDFCGSAGLSLTCLQREIEAIKFATSDAGLPWGMNVIDTPNELPLEATIVILYLKMGVKKVAAAAFMSLPKALVHYAFKGIRQDQNGNIVRPNHVFARI